MNAMHTWALSAVATCFALPAMAQDQNAWDQADENAGDEAPGGALTRTSQQPTASRDEVW